MLVYVLNPTSALTALRDNGLGEIRLEEAEVKKDYVSSYQQNSCYGNWYDDCAR